MKKISVIIILVLIHVNAVALDFRAPKKMPYIFTSNKMTSEKIELGKRLFFDVRVSGDNKMSCATCHQPEKYWSDGLPKAIGHKGKKLARSTPTIINVGYNRRQFWDGRATSLEQQSVVPIENPDEMNQNLKELVKELKKDPDYVKQFEKAFHVGGLNKVNIARALAAFQRSVQSRNSPFDRWLKGANSAMSKKAKMGFKLFKGKAKCSLCHHGFNFQDDGFHNIGLKSKDLGRYMITKMPINKGAFKTPTLRNVAKTAPYMHNGMYKTLKEVIQHYNRGGDVKDNLSENISPLSLTTVEIDQLTEFMHALTDKKIVLQAKSFRSVK